MLDMKVAAYIRLALFSTRLGNTHNAVIKHVIVCDVVESNQFSQLRGRVARGVHDLSTTMSIHMAT